MPSSLIFGQASETRLKLVEEDGFDSTVGSNIADASASASGGPLSELHRMGNLVGASPQPSTSSVRAPRVRSVRSTAARSHRA